MINEENDSVCYRDLHNLIQDKIKTGSSKTIFSDYDKVYFDNLYFIYIDLSQKSNSQFEQKLLALGYDLNNMPNKRVVVQENDHQIDDRDSITEIPVDETEPDDNASDSETSVPQGKDIASTVTPKDEDVQEDTISVGVTNSPEDEDGTSPEAMEDKCEHTSTDKNDETKLTKESKTNTIELPVGQEDDDSIEELLSSQRNEGSQCNSSNICFLDTTKNFNVFFDSLDDDPEESSETSDVSSANLRNSSSDEYTEHKPESDPELNEIIGIDNTEDNHEDHKVDDCNIKDIIANDSGTLSDETEKNLNGNNQPSTDESLHSEPTKLQHDESLSFITNLFSLLDRVEGLLNDNQKLITSNLNDDLYPIFEERNNLKNQFQIYVQEKQ